MYTYDNGTARFNFEHYMKVRDARKAKGMPIGYDANIPSHEWIGKKFLIDKRIYTIQSVHKHWLIGYYLALLLVDENHSHRLIAWQDICCHDEVIKLNIEANRRDGMILA